MTATLTENRYERKRYAVSPLLRQRAGVSPSRKKAPKTRLQALFLKRVQEELDARGLSRSALSKRVGGPSQTTFNEVMNGSDPRLETVEQIATALGVQPSELLEERGVKVARDQSPSVRSIQPFPPMMGRRDKSKSSPVADRKRRKA